MNKKNQHPTTICLNMIVRNESPVILRCLNSVKRFINYWVIVDTGSTDGTQQLIKECMKDIPGELHEKPWVDFGHNRTEALELAKNKADYLLLIDADEQLLYADDYILPPLEKDLYFADLHCETSEGRRPLLINNNCPWFYHGVLHEQLCTPYKKVSAFLEGIVNLANTQDGHRSSHPNKFLKDVDILEEALAKEPENSRYVFYLAQCHLNAKNYKKARELYIKRSTMNGNEEEIFWSKYLIGELSERLGDSSKNIINAYCNAFQYRPSRSEPLYRLAGHFRCHQNYILAYLLSLYGLSIPKSDDVGPQQHAIYDYGMLWEYAMSAYALGKWKESISAYESLLKRQLPEDVRNQVKSALIYLKELI